MGRREPYEKRREVTLWGGGRSEGGGGGSLRKCMGWDNKFVLVT